MIVKWLFGTLTGGVLVTLASNSFEAEVAGALGPGFTPGMLISLGLGLAGLGLWGRKKIFQGTPVDGRTPASGGKEGKHE
jgi:hypothetical protein